MLRSLKYAFNGITHAIATQRNMKIHFVALIVVVLAGFYFTISPLEWIAVIISIGIVFCAEIMNTAIEELVNFVSPERHAKAGLIKDLAAGAVLFTAVAALLVAAIIFIPKIY